VQCYEPNDCKPKIDNLAFSKLINQLIGKLSDCLVSSFVRDEVGTALNEALYYEDVWREWLCSSTHFKYRILDGDEWSASFPGRFNMRKESPIPI
jgi:hypothetical protein